MKSTVPFRVFHTSLWLFSHFRENSFSPKCWSLREFCSAPPTRYIAWHWAHGESFSFTQLCCLQEASYHSMLKVCSSEDGAWIAVLHYMDKLSVHFLTWAAELQRQKPWQLGFESLGNGPVKCQFSHPLYSPKPPMSPSEWIFTTFIPGLPPRRCSAPWVTLQYPVYPPVTIDEKDLGSKSRGLSSHVLIILIILLCFC